MIIYGDAKVIAAAFIAARKEMGATVGKDAKGNFGKYATLAAIVEATTEPFAKHGLAVVQEASADDSGVCVETWLVHESGATMQFSPLTLPLTDKKPQAVGSAITYARRYALGSICGLAPDDDDGQAAQDAQAKTQQARQAAQKTQNAQKSAARENVPTDAELTILGTWDTPSAAQAWAVEVGACQNEFEAKQSFKKIVDTNGGKLTNANIAKVYLDFLRHQQGKLQARMEAA